LLVELTMMERTEKHGSGVKCSCCLPEEIPEEVQAGLDSIGGVGNLPGLLPPDDQLVNEARVHKAMADPLRLRVLHMLTVSTFCVCVIRAVSGVEDSRLSYHLGILKDAGLVLSRKEGSYIIYSLSEEGVARMGRAG
jgi:ArsR family transcriptional regulator